MVVIVLHNSKAFVLFRDVYSAAPKQTIAWVYVTTPSRFLFDAGTSIPLSWVDYAILQVAIPLQNQASFCPEPLYSLDRGKESSCFYQNVRSSFKFS